MVNNMDIKPVTVKQLQARVKGSNLTYVQISRNTGVGLPWLKKVMRDKFINPNPKSMSIIMGYLDSYDRMADEYKKHTV